MKVVERRRFEELVAEGQIQHDRCQYLDRIKIGLHVHPVVEVLPATVDALQVQTGRDSIDFRCNELQPGVLYLASTLESIAISNGLFGLLHTRSRLARLGLDFLGSSNYVAPGFGGGVPKSLTLEVRSISVVQNVPCAMPVVGLILFEIGSEAQASGDFGRID